MLSELDEKNADIKKIAANAIKDREILKELIENLTSKNETRRYNSARVLNDITENNPKIIYPYWDSIEKLLESKNSYHIHSATTLLTNISLVDKEKKMERVFNKIYKILEGDRTVITANLVQNSGKIARAKPGLEKEITRKLLNIEKTHKGKQLELIKAFAIQAFDEYFDMTENKREILVFVKDQLKSESPKTRKQAEEFLSKRENK